MDVASALQSHGIAVNALITLDPVSFHPKFDPGNYLQWINVHTSQDVSDLLASAMPGLGNLGGMVIDLATGSQMDDVIGTLGGTLGAQSGAINIELKNVTHGMALTMFNRAYSAVNKDLLDNYDD
jgi:hypothetical protein